MITVNGIEAPHGGFATPVADVFAVELIGILKTQFITDHGIAHAEIVGRGEARQALPSA